ncbi:hypothetical protein ABW21_db0201878 [Orbilia brochopaga]|nr:hypothetical protein ABW21_db0201878 [Drechslerella brochopaga]
MRRHHHHHVARPSPSTRSKSSLIPVLARVVSGAQGTHTPVREALLRIIKVQGISMTAGPRQNPDDETEPAEGETLYAYRIFLTDDVYIVGAVVDPLLHSLVHDRVLMTGTLVRLTDYDVKTSLKKFSTGKYTRYLKVRDLIVEHSPSIRFTGEEGNSDTAVVTGRPGSYSGDFEEMVVIKQEPPRSQPSSSLFLSSSSHQADMRVDDRRDRADYTASHAAARDTDLEPDGYGHGYGVDMDGDVNLSQGNYYDGGADGPTMSPDSYGTAGERALSPDYTLDELDDLTEEELSQWPAGRLEPKTAITEETIAATWRSSQKEKMTEQKMRSTAGLVSPPSKKENTKLSSRVEPMVASSSTRTSAGNPLKRSASQNDELASSSLKTVKSSPPITPAPLSSPPAQISSPLSTPPTAQHTTTKLGDLFKKPLGTKVNVLAIVAACDERTIRRSIGVKRDLRLRDPSTEHNVWLSVWVDADKFQPAVGTCVLFRGLTVHRFDGRSLNAFKEVAGTEWHVIEPREEVVAGVEELKAWWDSE